MPHKLTYRIVLLLGNKHVLTESKDELCGWKNTPAHDYVIYPPKAFYPKVLNLVESGDS